MKTKFSPFYIVAVFVMLSLYFNAQSNENKANKRFSFGLNFSPDYSYRRLHMDNDEYGFIDVRNETESPRFGYTTGIVAKYKFLPRLAIESGIQFADKGEKLVFDDFVSYDGSNSQTDPFVPHKVTTKYHYYYIGIPLKLNYYLLQNKTRFFVTTGASTDFYVDNKSKTVAEFTDRTETNTNSEKNENINAVNFVGLLGFGIETNVSKRLQIRFEPIFRFSFTPVADGLIKDYLYSIRANFTIFYH